MGEKPHLKQILEKFESKNLQVRIGVELEFYLQQQNFPANSNQVLEFIEKLKSVIPNHNIDLSAIEPEQGEGQIEIKTNPYFDIPKLCNDINRIKEIAQKLDSNLQTNFSSLPNKNDCGNAMQINFSLIQDGKFLFAKDDAQESKYLLWSISGALEKTRNMIEVFAPESEDLQRFDIEINRNLHRSKKYTSPTNISWGYDNRSALIRVPATRNNDLRRIEYRLGCASCDIQLAITHFLSAVFEGIEMKKNPIKEIYGNAFDEQYGYLERLV